jgi:hypothetical protein
MMLSARVLLLNRMLSQSNQQPLLLGSKTTDD